jgi:hypothetical protein
MVSWMRGRGLLVEDCYIPVCRRWIGFELYETMFPHMLLKFVTVTNVINYLDFSFHHILRPHP